MQPSFALVILGFTGAVAAAFAQNPTEPGMVGPSPAVRMPALGPGLAMPPPKSAGTLERSLLKAAPRSGFLKNLTIDPFGYDLRPTGHGFESHSRLSYDPFTTHGLECPLCVPRPMLDRAKFTIPPFGSTATLKLWQDRAEMFTQIGGIDAWRPDEAVRDRRYRQRAISLDDQWLVQGATGARVAIDHNRRPWLGTAGRYFENLGDGKKHWNSFGGSATFQFGH